MRLRDLCDVVADGCGKIDGGTSTRLTVKVTSARGHSGRVCSRVRGKLLGPHQFAGKVGGTVLVVLVHAGKAEPSSFRVAQARYLGPAVTLALFDAVDRRWTWVEVRLQMCSKPSTLSSNQGWWSRCDTVDTG